MSDAPSPSPGPFALLVAAVFPAIVIAIEFATGLCAENFFDPLPTIGHLLLAAAVPAINALLWYRLRRGGADGWWLPVAGTAAAVVAGGYALLFVPLMPIAAIAVLLLGIGLLPFAPFAAFAFAVRWTRAVLARGGASRGAVAAGAAAGVAALALVDLPASATYFALGRYGGDAQARAGAVRTMRAVGDRDVLLRLSYGDTARATGLASVLVSLWSRGGSWSARADPGDARELYYRVTGEAFNAVARPGHGIGNRMRLFGWDEDQGGDAVGGRVPELALAGSRIDGSVASRDNLGYLEWTLALRNTGEIAREARLTMALPEGAVASRATLWVNGEPREASIAARAAAKVAYAGVVAASRDPLLVTTDGAGRLLVQAFPVPAHQTLTLRIGMTAPATIADDGGRTLAMPAIVERNFDIADDLRHRIWIEGDSLLASRDPALAAQGRVVRGAPTDADLLGRRARIALPRAVAAWTARGGVAASAKAPALAVEQMVARRPAPRASALMLVVDGSAGNAAAGAALAMALDALPAGMPVGLAIAADTPVTIAPQPWSPAQHARIAAAIGGTRFVGGQDDRAALATALAAVPDARAAILWVHGTQPVAFAASAPDLEQALARLPALPTLVRYQAQAGRAATGDARWFATTRFVAPTGDPAADLAAALRGFAGGTRWSVVRTPIAAPVAGSANLVRLWAAERIAAEADATGKPREEAVALAHRLNLVTPVSGAVVLESDRDYAANGLPVPSPEDVPTVPEPGTWALLGILALAGGWLVRHRRVAVAA